MKRSTRLYCHSCDGNFTVKLDYGLNGNHEIKCPKCGHIHYRVIEDGKVTGDRYRSSMQVFTYTCTVVSSNWTSAVVDTSASTGDYFLNSAWLGTT